MRHMILILVLAVAGLSCRAETAKSPEGGAATPPAVASAAPGAAAAAPEAPPDPGCGRHAGDWCAAPAGDPCGAHKNVASCRADARCTGRKFRGEGPECMFDEAGFSTNCPTVGCISR